MFLLRQVIVVCGDGACTYIGIATKSGITDVTQMTDIGFVSDVTLFDLYKISELHVVAYGIALSDMTEWSDFAVLAYVRVLHHRQYHGGSISYNDITLHNSVWSNHTI